jgi:hypothetical protein
MKTLTILELTVGTEEERPVSRGIAWRVPCLAYIM